MYVSELEVPLFRLADTCPQRERSEIAVFLGDVLAGHQPVLLLGHEVRPRIEGPAVLPLGARQVDLLRWVLTDELALHGCFQAAPKQVERVLDRLLAQSALRRGAVAVARSGALSEHLSEPIPHVYRPDRGNRPVDEDGCFDVPAPAAAIALDVLDARDLSVVHPPGTPAAQRVGLVVDQVAIGDLGQRGVEQGLRGLVRGAGLQAPAADAGR
ncbi:hypothetical protein [Sorangium sp. So ce854]|uniref:hypothetical protein n=1 Tax=Sorangium sp. So ce854 TaxID=3133322 RepID=UPI003F615BA0